VIITDRSIFFSYCQFAANYRMVSNTPAVPFRKNAPGRNISMGNVVSASHHHEGASRVRDEPKEAPQAAKRGVKRPRPDSMNSTAAAAAAAVPTPTPQAPSVNFSFNASSVKAEDDDYDNM
jgi:hypothetical protein